MHGPLPATIAEVRGGNADCVQPVPLQEKFADSSPGLPWRKTHGPLCLHPLFPRTPLHLLCLLQWTEGSHSPGQHNMSGSLSTPRFRGREFLVLDLTEGKVPLLIPLSCWEQGFMFFFAWVFKAGQDHTGWCCTSERRDDFLWRLGWGWLEWERTGRLSLRVLLMGRPIKESAV